MNGRANESSVENSVRELRVVRRVYRATRDRECVCIIFTLRPSVSSVAAPPFPRSFLPPPTRYIPAPRPPFSLLPVRSSGAPSVVASDTRSLWSPLIRNCTCPARAFACAFSATGQLCVASLPGVVCASMLSGALRRIRVQTTWRKVRWCYDSGFQARGVLRDDSSAVTVLGTTSVYRLLSSAAAAALAVFVSPSSSSASLPPRPSFPPPSPPTFPSRLPLFFLSSSSFFSSCL